MPSAVTITEDSTARVAEDAEVARLKLANKPFNSTI